MILPEPSVYILPVRSNTIPGLCICPSVSGKFICWAMKFSKAGIQEFKSERPKSLFAHNTANSESCLRAIGQSLELISQESHAISTHLDQLCPTRTPGWLWNGSRQRDIADEELRTGSFSFRQNRRTKSYVHVDEWFLKTPPALAQSM